MTIPHIEIGKRLINLSVKIADGMENSQDITKKQCTAAVKACTTRQRVIYGSKAVAVAAECVYENAQHIYLARCDKRYTDGDRLSWHTLAERREIKRNDEAYRLFSASYRTKHGVDVTACRTIPQCDVTTSRRHDNKGMPNAYKYPYMVVDQAVKVHKRWLSTVLWQGIAILDGMMTLGAECIEDNEHHYVYRATWCAQGKGYDIRVYQGWIAVSADEVGYEHIAYHSTKSPSHAVDRLHVKMADHGYTFLTALACERMAKEFPDLTVTVSDARKAGLCESGIEAWCNNTSLNYEDKKVALKILWRAYRSEPHDGVVSAIRNAARRNRIDCESFL